MFIVHSLILVHSLHSRPTCPFPHCARLVGCTLVLWVVSHTFLYSSRLTCILALLSTLSCLVALVVPYSYTPYLRHSPFLPHDLSRMRFRAHSPDHDTGEEDNKKLVIVMTTCNYDPDTFSFLLSSLILTTPVPPLSCTITYLVIPLFSFHLFPCTFTTASPAQPGL